MRLLSSLLLLVYWFSSCIYTCIFPLIIWFGSGFTAESCVGFLFWGPSVLLGFCILFGFLTFVLCAWNLGLSQILCRISAWGLQGSWVFGISDERVLNYGFLMWSESEFTTYFGVGIYVSVLKGFWVLGFVAKRDLNFGFLPSAIVWLQLGFTSDSVEFLF